MLQRVTWLCRRSACVQGVRSISDVTIHCWAEFKKTLQLIREGHYVKKHQNQVEQLSYCSQWPRGATAVLELVASPTGTTA